MPPWIRRSTETLRLGSSSMPGHRPSPEAPLQHSANDLQSLVEALNNNTAAVNRYCDVVEQLIEINQSMLTIIVESDEEADEAGDSCLDGD